MQLSVPREAVDVEAYAPPVASPAPALVAEHDAEVRISVVIAGSRDAERLQRCLAALGAQRFDAGAFEIVVVDDRHSAEIQAAVELCSHVAGAPAVRYVRPQQGRGPAAARNAGWRAAYGRLVAFIDDAAIPSTDWLASGERALTSDLVALCGKVEGDATEGAPAASPIAATPIGAAADAQDAALDDSLVRNAFVRRSALFAVGGFDERFDDTGPENADLQFRLQRDAGRVGHSDAPLVHRTPRRESWSGCLARQRRAYFAALLFKKHPQLCRERALAAPPWDYYAIVALLIGALMFWLLDIGGSAVVSLLVGLGLVVRLALRRLPRAVRSPERIVETLITSALIPFLAVYWRLRGAIHFRVLFL